MFSSSEYIMNTYEPAYMNIYEGSSAFLVTFRLQVLLLSSQLEAITNLKRLKQQRQKKSLARLAQSHFWVDDHIKEARVKSLQNRERERDSFSKSFHTSCKGKVQPHCPGTVLKTKSTTWNSQRHLTANETDDALDGSDLRRPQTTQSPSHILATSRLIFFAASRSNVRFASTQRQKVLWFQGFLAPLSLVSCSTTSTSREVAEPWIWSRRDMALIATRPSFFWISI